MKRMICAVLIVAMLLSLSGCGCHRTETEKTAAETTDSAELPSLETQTVASAEESAMETAAVMTGAAGTEAVLTEESETETMLTTAEAPVSTETSESESPQTETQTTPPVPSETTKAEPAATKAPETAPVQTTAPETEPTKTEAPATAPAENTAAETVPQTTAETTEAMSTEESAAPTEAETPAETTAPAPVPSSMTLKKAGSLQYYLYTPANAESGMPLIIYLHGGTNKKADVSALLTTDGFPKYLYENAFGDLRAYVSVPKLEDSYTGWADISDRIRDMINSIRNTCGIDMGKIALTGHSMGGTGVWQLQVKMPNTFAAIAPLSGSIQNTERNLTALKKTKVWAFVGTADTIVDPEPSRVIVNALTAAGADAKLTELEGTTHFDVSGRAYKETQLIEWLVRCGR